jgi:lycopene cyclase domain-containing protein
MEYTILSALDLSAAALLAERSKLPKRPLIAAAAIAIFFQLVFDNLMTAYGLWIFDFSKTLGIAVPVIPLENLFFGLSLMIFTVVCWERLGKSGQV